MKKDVIAKAQAFGTLCKVCGKLSKGALRQLDGACGRHVSCLYGCTCKTAPGR